MLQSLSRCSHVMYTLCCSCNRSVVAAIVMCLSSNSVISVSSLHCVDGVMECALVATDHNGKFDRHACELAIAEQLM